MSRKRLSGRRLAAVAVVVVLAIALAGEIAARAAGMVDFPLYDADATIGYIPKANQHGSFLNTNDWVINERHMAGGPFVPDPVSNVLLVGDSIVWGGNPYKAADRLGARLQGLVKGKVWTISAGSWGLQNEVAYLDQNPDVVAKVDTIAIVSNHADFDEPSSWSCTATHPRSRPVLALAFLADKYLLKTPCEGTPPELKVPTRDALAMLAAFLQSHPGKRVVVFLYPDKLQMADEAELRTRLDSKAPLLAAAGVREIVHVARDERWRGKAGLYRDGAHPTPEGNAALAAIITSELARPAASP